MPATLDPQLVAHCRAVMAHHARSFDRAAALFPRATRDRVAIFYALCREIDDTADEATDPAQARVELAAFDAELAAAEAGDPSGGRPVVRAFAAIAAEGPYPELTVGAARELVRGVTSDLETVRVADDRELLRYCYRVAGAVGLMMCGVIGVTQRRALPFAIDLGVGMQLTNICRDVREDAEIDRVYLPTTRLAAAGTDPQALIDGRAPRAAVRRVVADVLALADRYYASGDRGLRFIPWVPRAPIMLASRLYRGIGQRLLRLGGDPLVGRTIVPPAEKAVLAARALLIAAHPQTLGLTPEAQHDAQLHAELDGLPAANDTGHR